MTAAKSSPRTAPPIGIGDLLDRVAAVQLVPEDVHCFHRQVLEACDAIDAAALSIDSGDWSLPPRVQRNLERIRAATDLARSNTISAVSLLADLADADAEPTPEEKAVQ